MASEKLDHKSGRTTLNSKSMQPSQKQSTISASQYLQTNIHRDRLADIHGDRLTTTDRQTYTEINIHR